LRWRWVIKRTIVPSYLQRFRKTGQFRSDNNVVSEEAKRERRALDERGITPTLMEAAQALCSALASQRIWPIPVGPTVPGRQPSQMRLQI